MLARLQSPPSLLPEMEAIGSDESRTFQRLARSRKRLTSLIVKSICFIFVIFMPELRPAHLQSQHIYYYKEVYRREKVLERWQVTKKQGPDFSSPWGCK